jgi:hypothetical protein
VLGVACYERPPRILRRSLRVTHSGQALAPRRVALVLHGEKGNGSAGKAHQVALTGLCEGLVGSSLQSVIVVIIGGCGELGHHARVGGVSRDVHGDLFPLPILSKLLQS